MTSNAITIAGLFASKIHTPLGVMAAICDNEGLLSLQWQQEDLAILHKTIMFHVKQSLS